MLIYTLQFWLLKEHVASVSGDIMVLSFLGSLLNEGSGCCWCIVSPEGEVIIRGNNNDV